MRLACSPFCGRLIDSFGERLVMAVGIFIVALSSGLAGIASSYVQLLALRGVGGIGSAMFTVSATTLLLTSVEAGLRGDPALLQAVQHPPRNSHACSPCLTIAQQSPC